MFHKTHIQPSKTKTNLTINSLFKNLLTKKTIGLDGFTVNSIKYFRKKQ